MSDILVPIITNVGLAAILAGGNGFQGVITEIALGDSAWDPDDTATELQNEINRVSVEGQTIGTNQFHLAGIEESTTLDYWVKEIGFYLSDGTLLAVWSKSDKVLAYKSSAVDLLLAFDLSLISLPEDSITINGTGGFNFPLATPEKRGVIRISDANDLAAPSIDTAVTPSQLLSVLGSQLTSHVSTSNPHNQYLLKSNTVSQAEAQAGTASTVRAWSALRVKQAILNLVQSASTTVPGIARIATQAEAEAGSNDTAFITPKKMRLGFAFWGAGNGFIVFPSWLGGLIIQWGSGTVLTSAGSVQTMTLLIPFPNLNLTTLVSTESTSGTDDAFWILTAKTTSTISVKQEAPNHSAHNIKPVYFAIGY
ncbi:MAG: hypothetical protein COA90_00880 [Gammaproteobacteria bacterium]|nr:MAG: hypothetical protein COA90_00880 [Gammaproteobacteria bacterium]